MAEFTVSPHTPGPDESDPCLTCARADWTEETLFQGKMTLCQPKAGYRYTLDPLLLCSQLSPSGNAHVLDLGCGCGIMPLILGYRYPETRITGVELQGELAALARHNVAANRMQRQIRILQEDMTRLTLNEIQRPADLIICNPPYKKKGTGRINPNRERAIARHEITVTIDRLFTAASGLMARDGCLCLIFPAERLKDLESAAGASDFFLEWTCFVHQTREKPPFRVMASATRNPLKSREVRPPVILYRKDGTPTKAHAALFNP